jgi:hypothetical protein
MPIVRFSVACLVALTCLGSSIAVAGSPLPGKGSKPKAAQIVVAICAGDVQPGLCGPKFGGRQLGGTWPAIARQAGTISATRPNIRCPGVCEAEAKRGTGVTFRASPRRDGYHEFDHWEGACMGTVPTCTLRGVQGNVAVKAVFRTDV